jgi:putative flavoprotein involved in K+ transport
MLDVVEETLAPTLDRWLADFDRALSALDPDALQGLFAEESHWRDLVAFSWHIQTVSGARKIVGALQELGPAAKPGGLRIDPRRTPPRVVTRAGREVVEAIFAFETAHGPASGLVRLIRDGDGRETPKAWTLMTSLDGITGFEETVGDARPSGAVYSRDFSGPNWLDKRRASAAYADRDPAVLVVGAGQAGLSIAARLRQWGVDTLVVDRGERVGDNWRGRYHALTLHNQVHVNHLPYMPFPPTWPRYIPKDMIGNWFESYAEAMELNVWTGTEFLGGSYDAGDGVWSVEVRRADGTTRTMRPRHVVMATGVSGIPSLPHIPSLENFAGPVLHSTQYEEAADWAGRNVVVIGSGTSGHDICQDLHSHGAHVTMVQRSPTTVVQVEPSAQLPYALYDEGPDLEDCDFIVTATPFALLKKSHQIMTAQCKELDKDLLGRLTKVGFRLDEDDDTGWQFKYLTRGGGYYFNVGCSDLIADGEVGLVQYDDIDAFAADGVRLRNGETLPADLVVLATGYKNQDYLVGQLFGEDVAKRVGPIWGFDPVEQELRNMWVRTGQPGLWFIAGSFAQCRIYSKYLGLQIKACEAGMIPAVR